MFTGFKILIKKVTLINLLYQVNNHIKQGAKMTHAGAFKPNRECN